MYMLLLHLQHGLLLHLSAVGGDTGNIPCVKVARVHRFICGLIEGLAEVDLDLIGGGAHIVAVARSQRVDVLSALALDVLTDGLIEGCGLLRRQLHLLHGGIALGNDSSRLGVDDHTGVVLIIVLVTVVVIVTTHDGIGSRRVIIAEEAVGVHALQVHELVHGLMEFAALFHRQIVVAADVSAVGQVVVDGEVASEAVGHFLPLPGVILTLCQDGAVDGGDLGDALGILGVDLGVIVEIAVYCIV